MSCYVRGCAGCALCSLASSRRQIKWSLSLASAAADGNDAEFPARMRPLRPGKEGLIYMLLCPHASW